MYLYDFAVEDSNNKVKLYGYMDNVNKKVEVEVLNIPISLHLRIERALLKTKDLDIETILTHIKIPNLTKY